MNHFMEISMNIKHIALMSTLLVPVLYSVPSKANKTDFDEVFEKMTPLILQKMELDRIHRAEKNSAAPGINQVVLENLPAIEQKLKDCNEYLTQYETSREKVCWQDHELEAKISACLHLAALTRLATTFGKIGSPAGRSLAGNQFEDKASELGLHKLSTIGTYKYLHRLKELQS